MSVKLKVNFQAVNELCLRLGIQRESDEGNQELRDEALHYLSKDMQTLERLAASGRISLLDLYEKNLLPHILGRWVHNYAPRTEASRDESNEYFVKDLGEVTEADRIQLLNTRSVGERTAGYFAEYARLHRETLGFRTLIQPGGANFTATDEIALIGRIVDAIQNDPDARRKLLAMFPAPVRAIPVPRPHGRNREP